MDEDKIITEENIEKREDLTNNMDQEKKQEDDKAEERKFFEDSEKMNQSFRPEMVETNSQTGKDKLNSTYILLAVFIVLLGVSYLIKNKPFQKNDFGDDKKIVTNVGNEEISKIEMIKNGKTTVLEKTDGVWKVASEKNFKADQEAVQSIVEQSLKLNKYILASENKEKQKEFEVNDELGINVKLYKGSEEISNFYLGKAGPDFASTYVRVNNEDSVYLSKGFVKFYFDKDDWRDLAIYNFESGKVTKLALKYRDVKNNVIMEKNEEKWQIKEPVIKEADKTKVDAVLNTLGHLNAKDVESKKNAKEAGFAAAPLVVRLELDNGEKKNLLIGGKIENEDKYYVKREEDDIIYIINVAEVDNIMKKVGDF